MFSPRSASRQQDTPSLHDRPREIPLTLATSIATVYASLSSPGACPRGVYLTPSLVSLTTWDGVLFVHRGPYDGAILRFSVRFGMDFPRSSPVIRFNTDVYHPMVNPKTMIWSPRGDLKHWQPGRHHVLHLLRALKDDFRQSTLDAITEDEAINKQLYSLYKTSHHTFLSMTAQRCRNSSSDATLCPPTNEPGSTHSSIPPPSPTSSSASKTPIAPSTPTKQSTRTRLNSGLSSTPSRGGEESGGKEGTIRFKVMDREEEMAIMARLRQSGQNRGLMR